MGNKPPSTVVRGRIGELLVQLSLLTFGIESIAPLIDSGSDLIAVKSSRELNSIVFKTIQVKTESCSQNCSWLVPARGRLYHILALVRLGTNPNKFDDKTESCSQNCSWLVPARGRLYHILALVRLGTNPNKFDDAKIYLIPRADIGERYDIAISPEMKRNIESYAINEQHIERLFS